MSNLQIVTQKSDLNQFLSTFLKKDELINLCKELYVNYIKSWNKEKLALSVEARLLENPELFTIENSLPSLLELKKLINAQGKIDINNIDEDQITYFFARGIITLEEDVVNSYLIMPDNLREAIIPVIDDMLKDKKMLSWHKIECLYIGLLNCYGILSVEDFLENYNNFAEDELSLNEILNMRQNRIRIFNECGIKIINHRYYLQSNNIENTDAIFSEIQKNSKLISRMFSLKEILLAGEPVFVPATKEAVTLSKILVQCGIPKKKLDFSCMIFGC